MQGLECRVEGSGYVVEGLEFRERMLASMYCLGHSSREMRA